MQRFFAMENDSAIDENNIEGEVFDAVSSQTELLNSNHEADTVAGVIDGIEQVQETLQANVTAGTATQAVVEMANLAIEQHLARIGLTRQSVGLEAFEGHDPVVALETSNSILNRIAQIYVVSFKHSWDITLDLFRGVRGRLAKYETRLGEAASEFHSNKSSWEENEVELSLDKLWYHFATDKGQVKNLASAVKADVDFTEFAMKTYPLQVIKFLEDLAAAISAKPKDEKAFMDIVSKVDKLKHPVDMFDKSYLGGFKLLSTVGLVKNAGAVRRVVAIGDRTFENLATLATNTYIEETASAAHFGKKVASKVFGVYSTIGEVVLTKSLKVTLSDAEQIIKDSERSLTLVKGYLNLESRFHNAATKFSNALSDLSSEADKIGLKGSGHSKAIKQIEQAAMVALNCFTHPAADELYRALKGVKYCSYAIRRISYNFE